MVKKIALICLNILLCAIIIVSFVDRRRHFTIDTLNERSNFLQSQDLFSLERDNKTPCSTYWLTQWHKYATSIIAYAPNLADAHGLEGFYQATLSNDATAIRAYLKARSINPYAWSYAYNLGVIYYQQHDYAKALEFFKEAAAIDMRLNIQSIMSSKIYGDLMRKSKGLNISIKQQVEDGLAKNQLAIKAATYALQTGKAPLEVNLTLSLF